MVLSVSIGDFISALALLREIQCALKDTHGAASQYRAVMAMLDSLDSALKHLVAIDCEDEALVANLEQATGRFQTSIDAFLNKTGKYQPYLRTDGSGNKWKDALRKIQWTLFNKDDIHDFQAEILGYAPAIGILLQCVNM